MKKILFVCLGNICRSPLAEGVANSYITQNNLPFVAASRGTGDWHIGESPCEGSIKVAKMHGIDISHHKAQQISSEDIKNFDIIIALDEKNKNDLIKLGAENVQKLGDFGYNGEDVPDPYFFNGFEGFEKVFTMIDTCTRNLLDEYSK
jgi:protein-tyrosine phosphatase